MFIFPTRWIAAHMTLCGTISSFYEVFRSVWSLKSSINPNWYSRNNYDQNRWVGKCRINLRILSSSLPAIIINIFLLIKAYNYPHILIHYICFWTVVWMKWLIKNLKIKRAETPKRPSNAEEFTSSQPKNQRSLAFLFLDFLFHLKTVWRIKEAKRIFFPAHVKILRECRENAVFALLE